MKGNEMTKKHFKKLAEAISTIPDTKTREKVCSLLDKLVQEVNQFFNWSKWETACGVTHE